MALNIKEYIIVQTTPTAIVAGEIYIINDNPSFATDSSKAMIKGEITLASGDPVVLELIDIDPGTSTETPVALIQPGAPIEGVAKYGFVFTGTTGHQYRFNIYREVTLQTS